MLLQVNLVHTVQKYGNNFAFQISEDKPTTGITTQGVGKNVNISTRIDKSCKPER